MGGTYLAADGGGEPTSSWWGIPTFQLTGVPISGRYPFSQGKYPQPGRFPPTSTARVGTSTTASTCYAAGGMPLAFTQEDFLVVFIDQRYLCCEATCYSLSYCKDFIFGLTKKVSVKYFRTRCSTVIQCATTVLHKPRGEVAPSRGHIQCAGHRIQRPLQGNGHQWLHRGTLHLEPETLQCQYIQVRLRNPWN